MLILKQLITGVGREYKVVTAKGFTLWRAWSSLSRAQDCEDGAVSTSTNQIVIYTYMMIPDEKFLVPFYVRVYLNVAVLVGILYN